MRTTTRRVAAHSTGPHGPAGTHPPGRRPEPRSRGVDQLLTMADGFVQLFVEIEAGRRPRSQLAPLMTPMLYARLADVWVRGGAPATVLSVRIAGRGPRRCDVVAVVRRGVRCTAIALELVHHRRRGWLVSDVARPEQGALPPPPYPIPTEEDEADEPLPLVVRQSVRPAPELPPSSPDWFPPAADG